MRHKIAWLLVLLLLFALLGYIREFFFVHLNIIMYSHYYHQPPTRPLPAIMLSFTRLSYDTLYYSKYAYTLFFTILYFGLNRLVLKRLAQNAFSTRILLYAYALLLGLAGVSLLYGYFFNDRLQDDEYTLSRWLMGIAQSPIICLILLASEKLYNKTTPS